MSSKRKRQRTSAHGGSKSVEMWLIHYETPKGSHKHVIWRGKTASGAVISFMRIAAPGTKVLETESHMLHYG